MKPIQEHIDAAAEDARRRECDEFFLNVSGGMSLDEAADKMNKGLTLIDQSHQRITPQVPEE